MTRLHGEDGAHGRQFKQEGDESPSILGVPYYSGTISYISGRDSTKDPKRRLSVNSSDEGGSSVKKRRDGSEAVETDGSVKTG